jgi:catechol-2,3-dioxygenase
MADTKINIALKREGGLVVLSFSERVDFIALEPAEAGQLAVALAHYAAADDQAADLQEVLALLEQIGKPNQGGADG